MKILVPTSATSARFIQDVIFCLCYTQPLPQFSPFNIIQLKVPSYSNSNWTTHAYKCQFKALNMKLTDLKYELFSWQIDREIFEFQDICRWNDVLIVQNFCRIFSFFLYDEDWIEIIELYEKKRSSIVNEFKVVSLIMKVLISREYVQPFRLTVRYFHFTLYLFSDQKQTAKYFCKR